MIATQEFEQILADPTKRIDGDIHWQPSESHDDAQRFQVPVQSDQRWPLRVEGWWNPRARKLSYTLLHIDGSRLIGLNLGSVRHRNPNRGERFISLHKHRWTEEFRDNVAYRPDDITAQWSDPLAVWAQFCAEVGILHRDELAQPMREGR